MSDPLRHECGIAMVRLKRPLAYYHERYGTALWGYQKLFLLMEKQHNRGQDGVGVGACKLQMKLGSPYIFRARNADKDGLGALFRELQEGLHKQVRAGVIDMDDPASVKEGFDFAGEILLGHLRYGTSGAFGTGSCHPYLRRSNWPTKTLMVAGNFNMTNTSVLNRKLMDRGQHPVFDTDTQTVLEEIGYHLDEAHGRLYRELRDYETTGQEVAGLISSALDIADIARRASAIWDGGYTIGGVIGNGDMFVLRDPNGIRPCHIYEDDEVLAVASERAPLMTVFGVGVDEVHELPAGHVLSVKSDGSRSLDALSDELPEPRPCSFERIYFSRGNAPDIYQERRSLGDALVPQVLRETGEDFDRTVVSFVPNTAEIAYHGLMDGLRLHRRREVRAQLMRAIAEGEATEELIDGLIMGGWPRGEKIAHKDIKLRTFISQEDGRNQLVSHVYDITYGVVGPDDCLVVIDDSIVRGTTLKQSVLKILARTRPRKIVVASTAPQIRYPDCYGIDMSEVGKFIAFQAAVELLKNRQMGQVLLDTYEACLAELEKPWGQMENRVKALYAPFSDEEISAQIGEMLRPNDVAWDGEIKMIFQTVENLHRSIPGGCGDWYFTGDYPTAGGYAVVNRAYVDFYEEREGRPYDLLFL